MSLNSSGLIELFFRSSGDKGIRMVWYDIILAITLVANVSMYITL